ncbi:oxidoreductase [Candidatus Magnetomorum sp. HK-1]|nr:oxidoreductase [Candidatus Magnetomorum sp. HK-1]
MNKKVMLITGTSQGIGRHLAEHYASDVFFVIGCSRRSSVIENDNYQHFELDIIDEKAIKKMFSNIRKTYGRLDVLINNAGLASKNYAALTSGETMLKVLQTNTIGSMLTCREATRIMRKKKFGRIVNISSLHVPLCFKGTSVYGASKAGIEQFARVLAREMYPEGITVNNLELSAVKGSGMVETVNLSDEIMNDILEHTISKAWLEMEDVWHTIDFLISKKSEKISGQTIFLGGI